MVVLDSGNRDGVAGGAMVGISLGAAEEKNMDVYLKFRVVVYPSEETDIGKFTAHCLNMDIIADDDTVEGAVNKLLETIEFAVESSVRHKAEILRDAPKEYWDKLDQAQEIPGELLERIILNANKRHGNTVPSIDIRDDLVLKQLATAC